MIAAGLLDVGFTWGMALLWLLLGNFFCLVVILLNGHAGPKYGKLVHCRGSASSLFVLSLTTFEFSRSCDCFSCRYGVPFPVMLRASFGHRGALATSLLRTSVEGTSAFPFLFVAKSPKCSVEFYFRPPANRLCMLLI